MQWIKADRLTCAILNTWVFGLLLLVVSVNFFTPQFGGDFIAASANALICGATLALAIYALRRKQIGWFELALFAAAGLASLHYLHISRNNAYTNDWQAHLGYAEYVSQHWLSPYGYTGGQQHQPPLYYYLAGFVIWFARQAHLPELTALRYFSWVAYLVFNVFSLFTLRLFRLSGSTYRACVALLLLWPAGIHLASKINNELLFFACYAAALYYIVRWQQEKTPKLLRMALALSGIAFMARSNSVILFPLIALFMGAAWYNRQLYLGWRANTKQWTDIILGLGMCFAINMLPLLLHPLSANSIGAHWGWGSTNHPFLADHFLFMNYNSMIQYPFNDWSMDQSFWDYLLKTAIFGEYPWAMPQLATGLDILLFAIGCYTFLPWLFAKAEEWKGMLPIVAGTFIPLAFLVTYAAWKHAMPNQDARLIYPALPCFVAWFGRSHAFFKARETALLAALGPCLAWTFVALGLVFFWDQVR